MNTTCFWDAIQIQEVILLGFTSKLVIKSNWERYSLIFVISARGKIYMPMGWSLIHASKVNGVKRDAMKLTGFRGSADMASRRKLSSYSLSTISKKKTKPLSLPMLCLIPIHDFKIS